MLMFVYNIHYKANQKNKTKKKIKLNVTSILKLLESGFCFASSLKTWLESEIAYKILHLKIKKQCHLDFITGKNLLHLFNI